MRVVVAAFATSALLLAACGGDGTSTAQPSPPAPSPAAATPTAPAPAPAASNPATAQARGRVIKTANSQFGQILFDGTGQAIYLFDKEKTAKPECYGGCAEAWPPVLTKGTPVASGAASADRLGTAKRTDGTTQVTYAGHPLYYYAHEGKNQVLCHNVRGFGGLWLVVTPGGDAAPH